MSSAAKRELNKPTWVFLEANGYHILDVHGDWVTFCRRDSRTTVYIGKYSLLPEVAVLQRYQYPVISLRFVTSKFWIRVVVAHVNGIEIIQIDDIADCSVQNKRVILSNAFLVDETMQCLFAVDPTISVLIAILGSQLRLRSLTDASSEFFTLGSHTTHIQNMGFCKPSASLLVTCSEETCKIWNLELKQLVHTINYARISPKAFCYHPDGKSFIFGTQDGKLITVDMMKGSFESYELCKLQDCKFPSFTKSSIENNQKDNRLSDTGRSRWSTEGFVVPKISDEFACCILSLTHVLVSSVFPNSASHQAYPCSVFKLVIVTSSRVGILDVATVRWDASWKWTELGLKGWSYVHSAFVSSTPHAVHFWIEGAQKEIVFFTIPLVNMVPANYIFSEGDSGRTKLDRPLLSLLASEDLHPNSILRAASTLPKQQIAKPGQKAARSKTSLNKPVTFGHTIKSSGYAKEEPKRKMFQPITSTSRTMQKPKQPLSMSRKLERVYETSEEAPNILCRSGPADSIQTPVYCLAYSPSGGHVAAALGNAVCLVLRCPSRNEREIPECKPSFGLPNGDALCGHKGPVLSAAWSTNSRLLITSSADRTARLWSMKHELEGNGQKTPPRTVLVFDSTHSGASNGYGEQTNIRSNHLKEQINVQRHNPFPDSIHSAQFYYMDSFIYLVCRNIIRLYSYKVNSSKSVLDKGKASCFYKMRGEFPIDTCNQLTAVSSVNIFYSYLMLCAGSDRRLSVLDLNTNSVVLEIENAHSRNITGIALNQGSVYHSLTRFEDEKLSFEQASANSYNTYATVAPGDSVRMWDLRDGNNAVMQFVRPDAPYGNIASGPSSNPLIPPVTAAFSPCGRQLIVGGRVTPNQPFPVIYDTRRAGSHPLATLAPKSEKRNSVPTTVVAWHPMRPEVTTGSHDGYLATYTTGLH